MSAHPLEPSSQVPGRPERGEQTLRVRRSPRFGVFAALGAAFGVLVALILVTVFDGTGDPSPYTEVDYSLSQAFGFILLWCVPAGILLAMIVALLIERALGRRTREVAAVHEVVSD